MCNVLIRLGVLDLAIEMAEMREWLEQHKYEPRKFKCDRNGDLVVICAEFDNDGEAHAFERRFDTPEGRQQSQLRLRKPWRSFLDITCSDCRNAIMPETMEQVCWWRPVAEEIRTEAMGSLRNPQKKRCASPPRPGIGWQTNWSGGSPEVSD